MARKSRHYLCALFLLLLVSLLVLLKECSNSAVPESLVIPDTSEPVDPSVQSEPKDTVFFAEMPIAAEEPTLEDSPEVILQESDEQTKVKALVEIPAEVPSEISTEIPAEIPAETPSEIPVETSAEVQERINILQAEIEELKDEIAKMHSKSAEDTAAVADAENVCEVQVPDATVMQFIIKTNLFGWGLGITNLAFEMGFAPHWSFALPLYYSAWDYIGTQTKFRTFTMQPELRYWLREDNDGFFTGLHFGMSYYDVAFGGDYRYQDHHMETPAVGGGLSIGYRMPISRNRKWKLEFSAGVGAYYVNYDRFYNTPDYKEGLLVDSIETTYWGVDQVSISFLYSFDLRKKGGRK